MVRVSRTKTNEILTFLVVIVLPACNPKLINMSPTTDRIAPETNTSITATFTPPKPALFTPSPTVTVAQAQSGMRFEFHADDGQGLVGYFYPSWKPSAPIVILMHEFGKNQADWHESDIIPWMQNWGRKDPTGQPNIYATGKLPKMPENLSFSVITFDFRGHGESISLSGVNGLEGNVDGFLMDARAAYAIAKTLPGVDSEHIIGIGTSIGADAVVDACGTECSGAFSVSPGNWLNVDYADTVRRLVFMGIPVRCMYAYNDYPSPQTCWSIEPGDLYKIYAYQGIKHGMTFFVPRKMEANFGTNLLEFLQAASQ